jgi:hypothetical protein
MEAKQDHLFLSFASNDRVSNVQMTVEEGTEP